MRTEGDVCPRRPGDPPAPCAGDSWELKTLLNPLNVRDADAMARYARELGVFYEADAYAFPPVRRQTSAEAFRFSPEETAVLRLENTLRLSGPQRFAGSVLSQLQKYEETRTVPGEAFHGFTCGAGNSSCWITWQGEMTPCGMIASPSTRPLEAGFLPAWEALKTACDGILMSPDCATCEKRAVCTSCPAANLAETGRFDRPSPFHCRLTEETLTQMRRLVEQARAQRETQGEAE